MSLFWRKAACSQRECLKLSKSKAWETQETAVQNHHWGLISELSKIETQSSWTLNNHKSWVNSRILYYRKLIELRVILAFFFLFYGEKRVFPYLKIVIKGRTPLSQTLLKAKIDLLRRTYDKQFQEISNYNRRLDNGNSLIGTVISDINLNV